jgi:hypothetical protein
MERKMTPKGFLHKSSGKVSAAAFLSQHREFLTTGELAPLTSPILAKLDKGEILPTPALQEVQGVVLSHILAQDVRKGEESMRKAQESPKSAKPWTARILDGKGNVCTRVKEDGEVEDLIKSADSSSELDRWVDRRLFDGAPDWHGEITHATMTIKTKVLRNDAIARILRPGTPPAFRKVGGSDGKLGFGVKVRNDVSRFSRG